MRTKGVLILGLIVCWTTVCTGEEGFTSDNGIRNTLLKELAEEYLFIYRAGSCEPNPCKNDGSCEVEDGGTAGTKVTCKCQTPWTGDTCEDSPCGAKTCKNSGKCKSEKDEKCECPQPWSGDTCEESPCDSKPCKNGGTCDVEGKEIKCTCAEPWTGDRCEESKCGEITCKNNGKCEDEGEGENKVSKCKCSDPWTGDTCEESLCGAKTCKNSGKCKSEGEGDKKVEKCECPEPWSGDTCEESKCGENTCKNNGKCEVEGEGNDKVEKCKCLVPWTGETCEESPCDSKPCKNGGTCEVEGKEIKCTCAEPWTGDRCENSLCDSKPCKNGGTCEVEGKEIKCTCAEPWTGDRCENSPCDSKPCKNGGTCKVEGKGFKCTCPRLWIGETCGEKKTCSKDGDCGNDQKCVGTEEGAKICQCADGLSGNDCENNDWCKDTGKYKNCKSENGTCEYSSEKRSVICKCTIAERKLHPQENRCRETCANDAECKYEGKCEQNEGNKFCSCKSGLIGDKCQTVFDCIIGKYKECDNSGGKCTYDGTKAVCECSGNKKLHDKENVCKECDCGPKGACKFENGQKKCDCEDDFAVQNGKCKEICNQGECEYGSECKAFDESSFCVCKRGLSGDKCAIVNDCKDKTRLINCTKERGTCKYDEPNEAAICECPEEKELNPALKYCQKTCTAHGDCNGGQCLGEEGKKFCKCLQGLEGDTCGIVKDCVEGKYSKCEKSGGTCGFADGKATCTCPPDKALDESGTDHVCRKKCSKDKDCKNGGTCNTETKLCKCKPKTFGDICEDIEGCASLNCLAKNAECIYNLNLQEPTCKCLDQNYYYENGQCKHEWCREGCRDKGSTCDYIDGVGVCNCTTKGYYYDYGADKCKPIDSCYEKKCEGDMICSGGICKCPENHDKKNATKCEPKDFCQPNNKCFPDSLCEAGSSLGYVKCQCKSETKFYKSGKCEDGACFLPGHRKDCKKSCPSGMDRKDGDCKHRDEKNNCDADCGFLGWCKKINETAHSCLCDPNFAQSKAGKCVLKASAVCPKTGAHGDKKCKCEGIYKEAKNGITCELKSCSDEDVQNECKSRRAIKCVENWKNDVGYKCQCPAGYINDPVNGCIHICNWKKTKDECSAKGQICYLGQSLNVGDCRCPPTFIYDEKKQSCHLGGENTFMINRLPVLKKKYETVENNINEVLLSIDVSTAMKAAYSKLEFSQVLSFKEEKGVLFCDVWLQFEANLPEKFNASLEVGRWMFQLRELGEQLILLPGLPLSSDHLTEANDEELTLCTESLQQIACGTGSTCGNNRCSCLPGYREIESTIKESGNKRIVRCEDVDECKEETHSCKANSQCVNTPGGYFCKCNPGFKKAKGDANAMDKEACIGLCEINPCGKGKCELTKENTVDCTCPAGYSGSFCNRGDVNLAKAGKATKVVGAVLGTLLAIVIILIIVYIVRQRKNSYSEDFTPAPRVDNAEMIERRPMRGVTNRGYQ